MSKCKNPKCVNGMVTDSNECGIIHKHCPDCKGQPLLPMPEEWIGMIYNASNDPCDMLYGPCACGAWHSLDEWIIKRKKLTLEGWVDPDCTGEQPDAGEKVSKKEELMLAITDIAETANKRIADLQTQLAEAKERIEGLISGHFCCSPQLAKIATTCNCAHSDRHRAMDWAIIDKLQQQLAELTKLKDWAVKRAQDLAVEVTERDKEIEGLKTLCYRESEVLKRALKLKNNKSMIKVVADSLAEQALAEKVKDDKNEVRDDQTHPK